jgi:isopenicillin-N epimerase
VLATDLEYGALDLTWERVCDEAGARYVRAPIRLPVESSEQLVDAIWEKAGPRTRVLFMSHHTSGTAWTLPAGELCRRARERGIVTVVDGAHVPGHLPLDLRALDADYYGGNCHKWQFHLPRNRPGADPLRLALLQPRSERKQGEGLATPETRADRRQACPRRSERRPPSDLSSRSPRRRRT